MCVCLAQKIIQYCNTYERSQSSLRHLAPYIYKENMAICLVKLFHGDCQFDILKDLATREFLLQIILLELYPIVLWRFCARCIKSINVLHRQKLQTDIKFWPCMF